MTPKCIYCLAPLRPVSHFNTEEVSCFEHDLVTAGRSLWPDTRRHGPLLECPVAETYNGAIPEDSVYVIDDVRYIEALHEVTRSWVITDTWIR
jgi:hypothetical protein